MDIKVNTNLRGIKEKVLVLSGKGGVGKSTLTVNLARAMADKGKKVGILDTDIHGPNIPRMLGIEGQSVASNDEGRIVPFEMNPNFKVLSVSFLLEGEEQAVIWRGPLKYQMIKRFLEETEWGELDYLFIDSPPGTGDEPLSIGQLVPDAHALIVTTPQDVSILDSKKAITFVKTLSLDNFGIVENMSGFVCPHCQKETKLFKKGGGEKVAKDFGLPFLGSVPIDPVVVVTGDSGAPLPKDSASHIALMKIAAKISEKTGI